MRQPIQVLVYPAKLINGEWHYLLLHRLATRGGFWQGVTGGVEGNENVIDAASRELVEESGLVPTEIHAVEFSYSYPVADKYRYLYAEGVEEITEHVYVATVDEQQEPMIDNREHDLWEWCNLDEALGRLAWPSNVEALKRCDSYLKGHSRLG